jgi:hypothetical protein
MKISSAFPSDYLRAADLQGRAVTVTMAHVNMEKVGNDQKPILYFQGKERGLVLNVTNAKKIAEIYGDDTENWTGAKIVLYEAMVDFKGDTVAAIRVRIAPAKANGPSQIQDYANPKPRPSPPPSEDDVIYDDPIPF